MFGKRSINGCQLNELESNCRQKVREASLWSILGPFPDTITNGNYICEILNDRYYINANYGILVILESPIET